MASSEIILVDASVEVDDEPITVEGNTLVFVEGQGTVTTKAASRGGKTVAVHSEDITTKVGMIKLEMPASIASNNLARDIKARGPGRVIVVSGVDTYSLHFQIIEEVISRVLFLNTQLVTGFPQEILVAVT